jgi:hypothetical protein
MAMKPTSLRSEEEKAFWQKLVLPEEEGRWIRDWVGGYRWFRSPNVIQLERYRSSADMARIRIVLLGNYGRPDLLVERLDITP